MRRCVALLLCAACLIGCSAPAPGAPETTPLATFTPVPARATPAPVIVQAIAPQPPPQAAVKPPASVVPSRLPVALLVGRSGADLRVGLDVMLDEHAFLLMMAMQSAGAARLDEQIGVMTILDQNASTMAGIIGTVKGQRAAQRFLDAWRGQTNDLIGYAQGQPIALDAHRDAIASTLAAGTLVESDAAAVLDLRSQAQQQLADSIRAHDAARTTQQLSALMASSDDLARPLAAAIAAQLRDLSPNSSEGGDVDLRLQLDSALSAYLLFTAGGVEAAADGRSSDAQTCATAAGTATDTVASQLNAAFGSADLGNGVAERLRAQTNAYVAAAQGSDRAQAAADIDRLRGEIDALLSGANQLLAPGLLNQQLRGADQPLLTATDAFARRDYASAYAGVHEAVRQVQKPVATLALAIIDRSPGRYLALPTVIP